MKSTGVVRKIDELGRIVIPKEIRKYLGIKDGENLEIFLNDNCIGLKKHSYLSNYFSFVSSIVDCLYDFLGFSVAVFDREKIIYEKGFNWEGNECYLSPKFISFMNNREINDGSKLENFDLNNLDYNGYFIVYPMIENGDICGLLVIFSENTKLDKYLLLIEFVSYMIVNKISI